jgi:hypothetical protein
MEISKTNDCYNSSELLKASSVKEYFDKQLSRLLDKNFEEVESVIDDYNNLLELLYGKLEMLN